MTSLLPESWLEGLPVAAGDLGRLVQDVMRRKGRR